MRWRGKSSRLVAACGSARRWVGPTMLLAAGFSAFVIDTPASAAASCPIDGRAVHVILDVQTGTVKWRTSHGRSDLKRLARRVSPGIRQGHPLGLTVTEFHRGMKTQVSIAPLGKNRFCAVPVKVEVTIGYPEFIVYIDRRYRTGTCQYRQIKIHEQRHVDIYRRNLHHFAPLIRGRLKDAAARLKPAYVSQPAAAANLIQQRLKTKIDALVDRLQQATDADNGRIDTASSYGRIQKRCRSW